jgi:hypothetical protein
LACLGFTLLGYHFLFRFQIQRAKSEMRSFLSSQKDHKDLIEFSFNAQQRHQLEWESDSEFRLGDQMYDVIDSRTVNGVLVIRCIADKNETALLDEYQKLIQKNSTPDQPTSSLVRLISAQFILPDEGRLKPVQKIIANRYYIYSSSVLFRATPVFVHPPNFG